MCTRRCRAVSSSETRVREFKVCRVTRRFSHNLNPIVIRSRTRADRAAGRAVRTSVRLCVCDVRRTTEGYPGIADSPYHARHTPLAFYASISNRRLERSAYMYTACRNQ